MAPATSKGRGAGEVEDGPSDARSVEPSAAPTTRPVDAHANTIATPVPAPPPSPQLPIPVGAILGDYRVESKLGSGGMGDVYLGVHQIIGKRAAIKVLRADLCADAFSVERFIVEARVVNQIGNPNIVDVFAFGQTPDGRSFLVMELLQGETLRERILRGPLGVTETTEIVRPLVRALGAAHAHGVVHRDLKPDNVFLVAMPGERPAVKLLDFGIAKLVRTDSQMHQTATGSLVGTPMYIAPEQARAETVDHRADIYTLGGILFEMITGRPPFVAATAYEVVAKHLLEPPPRPSSIAPSVPEELDALIVAMLAKAPELRPTLAEIASALERVSDPSKRAPTPLPLPAVPTLDTALATRPRSRRRPVIVLVLAGLIALVAFGMYRRAGAGAAPDLPVAIAPGVTPSSALLDAATDAAADAAIDAAIAAGLDAPRAPLDASRAPLDASRPRPAPRRVDPTPPPRVTPPAGSGASDEQLIPRGSVPR